MYKEEQVLLKNIKDRLKRAPEDQQDALREKMNILIESMDTAKVVKSGILETVRENLNGIENLLPED